VPYRGHTRRQCKLCERPRLEGERFSARGKCPECGEAQLLAEHRELRAFRGPHYEHWRRRCLETLAVLPVDASSEERT
jgi:ribosomal protein S27AE